MVDLLRRAPPRPKSNRALHWNMVSTMYCKTVLRKSLYSKIEQRVKFVAEGTWLGGGGRWMGPALSTGQNVVSCFWRKGDVETAVTRPWGRGRRGYISHNDLEGVFRPCM